MTVPLPIRLLDLARRRARGGGAAELDRAGIEAGRGPYVPAHLPVVGPALAAAARLVTGRPAPGVSTSEVTVPGAAGDLVARRHQPAHTAPELPLVLFLHGGGWTVGAPDHYDWLCTTLASELGAVVVAPAYRLAPDHPAPAAAEDAVAVARWLLTGGGATLGAPGPVLVAGDSAGGNLAALVAVAVRDADLTGLVGQLLVYPATDLTMGSESATALTHEPMLHRADMDAFVGHYLSGGADASHPSLSPLFVADLRGVAPACVQVAEHDPLKDEGRAFAERLAAADVPVRLTEYVDMPHGFVSLPGLTTSARQAVGELVQFARPLVRAAG